MARHLYPALVFLISFVSCFPCIFSITNDCSYTPIAEDDLPMDVAQVRVMYKGPFELSFYATSTYCFECVPQFIANVSSDNTTCYFPVSSQYPINFEFRSSTTLHVSQIFHPLEHAAYSIHLTYNITNATLMSIIEEVPPTNAYIPLWICFFVFLGAAIAWPFISFTYRKVVKYNKVKGDDDEQEEDTKPKKNRISSLDAFRGLCILVMIFVNYGGGGYWFFNHSVWDGLTVADLVFPWFIFIMGIAMPMSFSSLEKRRVPVSAIMKKVIQRSIILFGLGLFLNNGSSIGTWRILGVLQRFGGTYLFTSLIIVFVPTLKKQERPRSNTASESTLLLTPSTNEAGELVVKPGLFEDLYVYIIQWIVASFSIVVWLCITFLLNVPGCGKGYLGPGGIGNFGMYQNCTGGAALYVDEVIFGSDHIFNNPTTKVMYETGSFDPEGTLGYLTSIFLCFIGVSLGRIFLTYRSPHEKIIRMVLHGIFWGALGTLLCKGSQFTGWIPINKNLWSLSFIFVMAGTGFLVQCLFYLLIDVFEVWNGSPFRFLGTNSIVLYMGHEILGRYFPFSFSNNMATYVPQHPSLLLQNVIGTSVWVLIGYLKYVKKFFVKI
eukprot:TRINITY_DN8418_c0_g1_i3.p1 TRINITY_DN8418_c0_g1~~TRINITY_DN8418_c0_g1_i3.p1  ORF type:complete len:606 (-),score=90.74 TRINITY_DN8418_c0_g1_i3:38-1855(-)